MICQVAGFIAVYRTLLCAWWLYTQLVAVYTVGGCIYSWWLYTQLVAVYTVGGCIYSWWLYIQSNVSGIVFYLWAQSLFVDLKGGGGGGHQDECKAVSTADASLPQPGAAANRNQNPPPRNSRRSFCMSAAGDEMLNEF
jgi:hypothetical protein